MNRQQSPAILPQWADALLRPPGLVALWCLLVLTALWLRPLLPIDETRYLSVAWEMWQRGDFLVPYKNGEPYSHKPPLLFWLIHGGWWVFGVNDWWPRLVTPLIGLANLFLVRHLAGQLWPDIGKARNLAPAALLAGLLWAYFSTALMFDMLVVCCTLMALVGLLRAWRSGSGKWWLMVGLALGLGVLAKGPVILLYTLPPALLPQLWMAESRPAHWSSWYLGLALALVLAIALALAWALPAANAGGEEYANAILWSQTTDRVTSNVAHPRPVWWYLFGLPLSLLPLALWPGFWRAMVAGARRRNDSGARICLLWLGSGLILLSAVSSKQPHYLLPLFPAMGLLLARGAGAAKAGRPVALGVMLLASGSLILSLPYLETIWHQPLPGIWWAGQVPALPGWVLVGMGIGALVWRRPWPAPAQVLGMASGSVLIFLGAHLSVLQAARPAFDLTPMAQHIQQLQQRGVTVAHFGTYHGQYQFLGRLAKPLLELSSPKPRLDAWFAARPDTAVVHYSDGWTPDLAAATTSGFAQPYRGGAAILSLGPGLSEPGKN